MSRSSSSQRFASDERGAVAVLFGLIVFLILSATGGAVDWGRWNSARTQTKAAMDAAVLAGARSFNIDGNMDNAIEVARTTYRHNVETRLELLRDTIDFEPYRGNKGIAATGTAALRTYFLQLIGINELPLVDDTGAELSVAGFASTSSNMEVALMLDVTGSMCNDGIGPCSSGTKLSALKAAARDLVRVVVWDDQSQRTSKVALIPFSTRVRVDRDSHGSDLMQRLTGLPRRWTGYERYCSASSGSSGSESNGSWTCVAYNTRRLDNAEIKPCVTDRYYESTGTYDYTDRPPGPGRWLNAHDGSRKPFFYDSSDAALTSGRGATAGDPASQWNYDTYGPGECSDVPENNIIMPLTNDRNKLYRRIDELVAYGSTSGALGTAFSWYMLSPDWASVWPADSAPRPYSELTETTPEGTRKLRKVAILMSDGVYNTVRGWKDWSQADASAHAVRLCSNMKARGIEIFTVGFELDSLPAAERRIAEDTLRACGSTIDHFYNSLNNEQLQAAFRDIAVQLTSVRLVR